MTFAGRYPPTNPTKHARFLAERKRWHDWRNGLNLYVAADSQQNFYTYLREHVDLGADNYDDQIGHYITLWLRNSQSANDVEQRGD